jgi:uncharacterized membrane protein YqhA
MRVVALPLLVGLAVGVHGLLLLPVVGQQVKVVREVPVVHLEPLMAQVVVEVQAQLVARVLVLLVVMVAQELQIQLPELLGCLRVLLVVEAEVAS